MKVGNLVKHRSKDGLGIVTDTDGMRYELKIVYVAWFDQRGAKYEPVNELRVINESR